MILPMNTGNCCISGYFLKSQDITVHKLDYFLLKGRWSVREEVHITLWAVLRIMERTGEMARWLGVCEDLDKDLGSVPGTHELRAHM